MDSDLQERQQAFLTELQNIREESNRQHMQMVEENKKTVDNMQYGYKNVLEQLCRGLGKLGMVVAEEAMRRQECSTTAFQKAVEQYSEIAFLSTGQNCHFVCGNDQSVGVGMSGGQGGSVGMGGGVSVSQGQGQEKWRQKRRI